MAAAAAAGAAAGGGAMKKLATSGVFAFVRRGGGIRNSVTHQLHSSSFSSSPLPPSPLPPTPAPPPTPPPHHHRVNPPDATNPDPVTLQEQWRYATRMYSKWYAHAWGTAILAGLTFYSLGWFIKGENPLSLGAAGKKQEAILKPE